jgi:hypothetical protein
MDREIALHITGDVTNRQELLNGTESITLEGASGDGTWSLTCEFSWNRGLVEHSGEGDITLTGDGGDELLGTLTSARASERPDGALEFDLRFELDGGAGAFSDAAGEASAKGVLGADTFDGEWLIRVTPLADQG